MTASFAEDHEEDDRLATEIGQLGDRIRSADETHRIALGIEVHERFNSYVGIYLGHLYREETELQQALWDNFTDEELIAMDGAIAREIPPERMGDWLTEMGASYNPDEIKELKELIIQQSEMLKEQQQAIQRLESKFNDTELKQLESQETKEELPDTENKNSSESDEQVTEQPLENENTDRSTNEEVQEKKGFWKKLFGY